MNWLRLLVGHWMLAKSRRHSLAAARWMSRSEKFFNHLRLRQAPATNSDSEK